jgi:hypothetical protein
MKLLLMLAATALLIGCAPVVSNRPCPRVTEFPPELQKQAALELERAAALTQMMNAMAVDRAFNRAICE